MNLGVNAPVTVIPKTGYLIQKDRLGPNSHGGSAFKLFLPQKGGTTPRRTSTLDVDGKVLRK